jgi:hypothetical protein
MTTPTPDDEPTAVTPPEQPADQPDPAAAQPAAAQPEPAQPQQAVPPPPAASPFAPVARAPRTPWVNPDRRVHVAAAVILTALIFGGGGILIGNAIADNDHDRGTHRMYRMPGLYGRDGQQLPGRIAPVPKFPRQLPSGFPTPAQPAPTPTKTG